MKSIIEVSAYVIVITIMCYLGIDYVKMNMQISHVNESVQYAQDYIQIHGKMEPDRNIDRNTMQIVGDYMKRQGFESEFVYDCDSDDYHYFIMTTKYKVGSSFLNVKKEHTYSGMVRVSKV